MTDRVEDGAVNRRATVLWALGLATLVVTPSAYFFFETIGAPFDAVFVGNFYHAPLEDRFEPFGLLIALALAAIGSVALTLVVRRWLGPAFPVFRLAISVLALLYALNFLRSGVFFWYSLSEILALLRAQPIVSAIVVIAVLSLILFVLVRYRRMVDAVLSRVIQAYALVGIIFVFNAVAAIVVLHPHRNLQPPPVASAAPAPDGADARQFVWVIFDQADEAYIFGNRDATVELPQFDRLKAQSISTAGMYSPLPDTFKAIPSLTMGRKVDVKKGSPDSPLVERLDGTFAPWSDVPTAFSDAHEAGIEVVIMVQDFNTGGYCRVFVNYTSKCWQGSSWRDYPIPAAKTIAHDVHVVFKRFVYAMPLVRLLAPDYFADVAGLGLYPPQYYADTLFDMRDAAVDEITRPVERSRLVYLHWNVPHQPYIYDRHRDVVTEPQGSSGEGYLGNLELTDIILGNLLDALEGSVAGKSTTLLVSGDHGTEHVHGEGRSLNVPFLLLSSDLQEAAELSGEFSATTSRTLIRESLAGEVRTLDDVRRILGE